MAGTDFTKQMNKIADRMGESLEFVARGVLLDLFANIVFDTPVDTGRLQGNWQTSVGSPTTTALDRMNSVGPILEITSMIKGPDLYFFTNNLPYAERIEFDGWSHTKAPAGMVRINIDKTEQLLNKRAREAR